MFFRFFLAAVCLTCFSARAHLQNFSLSGYAAVFKLAESHSSYGILTTGKDIFLGNEEKLSGTFAYETKVKNPKFDWDTGFGLNLRYRPCCSCWDLSINWLHYQTDVKKCLKTQVCDGCGTFFAGNWSAALFDFFEEFGASCDNVILGTELMGKALAKHNVHLDIVDFLAAHRFCPTSCFLLRPFVGIRLGLINQHIHEKNRYLGIVNASFFDKNSEAKEKIKLKNDFSGCGILAGIEGEYALCGCYTVHGTGDISLLNGQFCLNEKYLANSFIETAFPTETEEAEHKLKIDQKERLRKLRAIADLTVGLRWRTRLCQNRYTLMLQINWENHFYFGQNQLRTIGMSEPDFGFFGVPQNNRGDLSLCGWTFLAQICF